MKIIDYILDRYFSKKTAEEMINKLRFISVDKKIRKTKNSYQVLVKKKREKDEFYKVYTEIYFNEALIQYNRVFNEITTKDICERCMKILEGD